MVDQEKREKERLEKISSPEELDQMLSIAQPKRRWLFVLVIALITIFLLWAFLGRIPIEISGKGIALSPKGVFTIESKTEGIVSDIYVQAGELVKPFDRIADINHPRRGSILQNISSAKHKIQRLQEELKTLESRLETRMELFEEGLIAKTVIEDSELAISQKRIQVEDAKAELAGYYSELETTSASGEFPRKRLFTEEDGMSAQEIDRFLGRIYAKRVGRVLEVLVNPGEVVKKEDPLVWLEYPHREDEPIIFFCTIPVQAQDHLQVGMNVRIEPTIVNPQEYGAIIGEITEVSPYVVSEGELVRQLHNPQLVKFLFGDSDAVMRLIVKPKLDPETESGFAWTSKYGPPFKIPTGTLCRVYIVVEEQPPISFVIPTWKLKPDL